MNKMVSLPGDLADAIEAKVAAGRYGSPGDVLRDALRLLDERDRGKPDDFDSDNAEEIDFAALKGGERRTIRAGELTDAEIALIAKAEVPAEHAHLDEELKDWRP